MSARGPKRVVLNSHRLFRDISPQVIRELALEELLEADPLGGDPELYQTIRQGGHKIVLTRRLRDEYSREARRQGLPGLVLGTVIQQLLQQGLIIEPRLPGGRPSTPGIRQRHNVFPLVAIAAQADYLITENPAWHSRSDTISQHGTIVVTPRAFIEREATRGNR